MSPEETFRRVLADRLPAGPGWTAWIDGTVSELAAAGVALSPGSDEAWVIARILRGADVTYDEFKQGEALAARLEGAS